MRALNPKCPHLTFHFIFYTALDNVFRGLRVKGVGSQRKATEALTKDEEELLWSSGAISTNTPRGLLRAVLFLNGKNFCLPRDEEHPQLKISQLRRVTDPPWYSGTSEERTLWGRGFCPL